MGTVSVEMSKLFEEWENSVPNYKGRFVKDGIINESNYWQSRPRILFVVKEPNDPEQTSWDLAQILNQYCTGNFSIRLSEWAYGISNNFPSPSAMTGQSALHEALKATAVINLKKTGGYSSSNMDEIASHTMQNKVYLLRQIELIAPELIIGGVGQTRIWNLLFDDIQLRRCDYDVLVGKWNNIKIIDYYHPGYRIPRAMSYSLLQNIVNSKVFKEM